MFSNLGPLFKATFRQAEQTDTRMAIRKDDPHDQGRKKDPPEEDEAPSDLWEDSMGVSIEALLAFLTNFVEGRIAHVVGQSGAGDSGTAAPADPAPEAPAVRAPQNTQTARAMQAYQSMAEKTGGAYHPPPPVSAPAADVDLLHGDDVRIIHTLITDLRALAAQGYDTLPLEKSDSFLHALQEAVSHLKSGV